jgi:hypothetical protein
LALRDYGICQLHRDGRIRLIVEHLEVNRPPVDAARAILDALEDTQGRHFLGPDESGLARLRCDHANFNRVGCARRERRAGEKGKDQRKVQR